MTSNIEKLTPDHPDYNQAKEITKSKTTKPVINYKALAREITSSPEGTIIKVEAPKGSYSNIKVGLQKRKVDFDLHYTMTYKDEVFYLTVKG